MRRGKKASQRAGTEQPCSCPVCPFLPCRRMPSQQSWTKVTTPFRESAPRSLKRYITIDISGHTAQHLAAGEASICLTGLAEVNGMLAGNLGQSLLAKARHALVRRSSAHLICLQHTQASDEDDAGEFRELVRDFATREIAPHAAEIDRNNSMPSHKNLWTELGHMGLHGRPKL